jgi:hypothetical protein
MPTVFRRRTPRGVGWRRPHRYVTSVPALREAVFAMAGAAGLPATGGSIASSVFASAGAGVLAAVGNGIKDSVFASAGAASVGQTGSPFFAAVFAMAGFSTTFFDKGLGQITSTNIIQKPVDYALAGDQDYPVRRGRAAGRGLKHTFGE